MEGLWEWSFGYEAPAGPLRRRRRTGVDAAPSPPSSTDAVERIMAAATEEMAAKGYLASSVGEIAKRASVSHSLEQSRSSLEGPTRGTSTFQPSTSGAWPSRSTISSRSPRWRRSAALRVYSGSALAIAVAAIWRSRARGPRALRPAAATAA